MLTQEIPLSKLFVSTLNVRKNLDAGEEDAGIADLANSILAQGLLSPLTVRPVQNDLFEVLLGQRRLLAARRINLDPVPCVVREDMSDERAQAASLIENVQRADMHPLDKARALKVLFDCYGSFDGVARETGWSTQTIRRYVTLLDLPAPLQEKIRNGDGTSGVAVLSRLATTFSGSDAIRAYDVIGGFNQRIQEQIIKQSNGNLANAERLAEEAREGAFDVRTCGAGRGCGLVQDILEGAMSTEEFEALVQITARNVTLADTRQLQEASRAFWKALAH
jgi:ParB family chromosome partitioning protein